VYTAAAEHLRDELSVTIGFLEGYPLHPSQVHLKLEDRGEQYETVASSSSLRDFDRAPRLTRSRG